MSMGTVLLIQFRAVLVLKCQPSVGPPTPSWIKSYNSPHTASIGFKKMSKLPVWQVALASIASPSHVHPIEMDGAHYQDANSVGCMDICAAIYAEIRDDYGWVRESIAVSIDSESSERSNPQGSSTNHRYYRFKISENVHNQSSRSIVKIKAFIPRIVRKLSASNKSLSNSREPMAVSTGKSNILASSTYELTKGNLGGSAIGYLDLTSITNFTEAYLLREDVQTRISECAQTLFERRRRRARPARSKKKGYRISYQCEIGDCVENDVEYADGDTLSSHLQRRHPHLPLSAVDYVEKRGRFNNGKHDFIYPYPPLDNSENPISPPTVSVQ